MTTVAPFVLAALAVLGALAALGLGLAAHFWRKRSDLQALLVEGASRYEELRQRQETLARESSREGERTQKSRDATSRLEASLAEAREQTTLLTRRLETRETEWRLDREKIDNQRRLLERHLEGIMEQQKRTEEQDAAATESLESVKSEAAARERRRETEFAQKFRDQGERLRAAEHAREDAEARARRATQAATATTTAPATPATPAADPAEMLKLKRRLAQAERLYAGMRGLREMADERNKNWEVALRRLARHVLAEAQVPETAVPPTLGPLVGMALQKIGATLEEDLPSGHTETDGDGETHSLPAESVVAAPGVESAHHAGGPAGASAES